MSFARGSKWLIVTAAASLFLCLVMYQNRYNIMFNGPVVLSIESFKAFSLNDVVTRLSNVNVPSTIRFEYAALLMPRDSIFYAEGYMPAEDVMPFILSLGSDFEKKTYKGNPEDIARWAYDRPMTLSSGDAAYVLSNAYGVSMVISNKGNIVIHIAAPSIGFPPDIVERFVKNGKKL